MGKKTETVRYKYPKTLHLPWSNSPRPTTRFDVDNFLGKWVVVTEKFDGENTTLYHDHVHARSIDSGPHPSRDWIKGFHASIKHNIPPGFRVCGENLYAKHSILYQELESYFLGFSVWEGDKCLPWATGRLQMRQWGITPVTELWEGYYDLDRITALNYNSDREGYVVRVGSSFHLKDFQKSVAKYVRKDHIQTDEHWFYQPIIKNGVKNE